MQNLKINYTFFLDRFLSIMVFRVQISNFSLKLNMPSTNSSDLSDLSK